MCGIGGYHGYGNVRLLQIMADTLAHRGPDGSGTWQSESNPVGLAHTRLSIVDISANGAQPMKSEGSREVISYNGELYNYKENKILLEKAGYRFKSKSDTEVVLNMYRHYGIDFLQRMNGIFALAIWDAKHEKLVLARDHAGVKPLYYFQNNQGFYFASEIRALISTVTSPVNIDPSALQAYLQLLYVPGPRTMFQGIMKVEPGNMIIIEKDNVVKKRWYQLNYEPDYDTSYEDWTEQFDSVFTTTIENQMMADVPVAAMLSGGLDSSAIVERACSVTNNSVFDCYTAKYPEEDLKTADLASDFPFAKLASEHIKSKLHTRNISPQSLSILPKLIDTVEEPDADLTALATYVIAQAAGEDNFKVLLSGTGGDEVFMGYRTHLAYKQYMMIPQQLQHGISKTIKLLSTLLHPVLGANANIIRRAARYANALPLNGIDRHLHIINSSGLHNLPGLLSKDLVGSLPNEGEESTYAYDFMKSLAILQSSKCEEASLHSWLLLNTFLSDHNFLYTDKCSMAHSVEVRVPFVDKDLLELASRVPMKQHLKNNKTKSILKNISRNRLPMEIINRKKVGFNPPIRSWIADESYELGSDLLSKQSIDSRGFFNYQEVENLLRSTRKNQVDGSQLIYGIQYLELWCRNYIDNNQTADLQWR